MIIMKIDVNEDNENKALQRRELVITVDYDGGPTPSSKAVGEALAKKLGVGADIVEIKQLLGITGAAKGGACAHVWATAEAMEKARPKKRAKPSAAKPAEAAKA
jgi:ribosomal protein S24E